MAIWPALHCLIWLSIMLFIYLQTIEVLTMQQTYSTVKKTCDSLGIYYREVNFVDAFDQGASIDAQISNVNDCN